jgi:predicted dehydrogenase
MNSTARSKYRFAIVGCGRMGLVHATRLQADPRAEVVALFDPLRAAAEQLRSELTPQAVIYESFDQLIQSAAADAIVICTPTTSHFEQVNAAAERGWHVLCEKPLAESRAHILQLIELAQARPAQHFAIAYQRRHSPVFLRLRDEIQSGRWGAIRAVSLIATERWQQTIAGTWRDEPHINIGGFLGDAGSHKIDMLLFTTGLHPTQVLAVSERAGSHVEIVTGVIGRLSGNVPFSLSFVGHANSFVEEFFIHCEQADLMLRDGQFCIAQNNRVTEIEIPDSGPDFERTQNPICGFLDLLDGRTENIAPFTAALPVWDFTQAILAGASLTAS